MFQFESLELLYWDCWERFRIPLEARVITVTGPNGSGKTTLLDALRTLLATKTSVKRDYKKYARRPNKPHSWIVGTVSNRRDARGRPPFFPITKDRVTLACHINKRGGDWQRSYYILPGVFSIEEIMALSENPPDPFFKPKGVKEYKIELEKAGLSHAMLTVLALEQGATDKLCEYSPKELLKLVYDAFGDKPTLENYERAIQDQMEAERELEDLRGKVDRLYNQCTALTNRVNNYREYEGLVSGLARLRTETISQARYVELYDGIKGASSNILGLKRELKISEEREGALLEDEKRSSHEKDELDAALGLKEDMLKEVQVTLIEENRKRAATETQLNEIKRLRDAGAGIEQEPVEPLQSGLDNALRERYSVEQKSVETAQRLKDLNEEKTSLLADKLRLDRPIGQFQERLRENGIAHTFLYENIEIIDEKWRVAIESLLRGVRYIILLKNPSDRWRAWKLGEEDGYRHFIAGEKGNARIEASTGSALEIVRLSEDVPEWVRRLLAGVRLVEAVEDGKKLSEGDSFITVKGFIRERRGGRSIAIDGGDFAFGEIGRKKRLESLERQLMELEEEGKRFDTQVTEIDTVISGLKERINHQETLQQYLSRKAEETKLNEQLSSVLENIDELEKRHDSLSDEKKALEGRRLEVERRLTACKKDLDLLKGNLTRHRQELNKQRKERCGRYQELRRHREMMPGEWRTPEGISGYKAEFDSMKEVQREVEKVDKRLQDGIWEKDSKVIELKEKVEKDYDGERANLDLKEAELSETRSVTWDARGAYIEYLRASMRFYEKNLKKLGELAGVGVEVRRPELENDDSVLREAGLEVKWNFDEKGFTSTDDGEGSGGQQVMKSLILLIALLMAEGDSSGCVFIDEPFAHLDVFNIDRVAEFLTATNAQYIITSPNTHNTNVYRPAFLTIVTRKKRPDRAFADPPGHLRRMEPANA